MRLVVPDSLRTERLCIRRHQLGDVPSFAAFLRDDGATRYLTLAAEQRTEHAARERIESALASYDTAAPSWFMAITDAVTGVYLGACGLHAGSVDSAVIYYYVVPAAQGRGIATEACRATIAHAFEAGCAGQVEAYVMPENLASIRVLDKLGFQFEGEHWQRGHRGLRYCRRD